MVEVLGSCLLHLSEAVWNVDASLLHFTVDLAFSNKLISHVLELLFLDSVCLSDG